MCLPCACLAVSEDGGVVALQHALDGPHGYYWLAYTGIHCFLAGALVEDVVEGEEFSICVLPDSESAFGGVHRFDAGVSTIALHLVIRIGPDTNAHLHPL